MKSNWFFATVKMTIIILSFYEFKGKLECLGENAEKCKAFSIPIEKEIIKIDKHGNESVVTTSYK